jgi:hypothetical protein
MKIINILIFIPFLVTTRLALAQDDVEKSMSEANDFYASGKLQDARFSLQQTLQALDVVIGKEILKILPNELNQFTCDVKQDNVMGSSGGMVGLNVSKYYFDKSDSSKTLNISVINNSPLIGTINAFMTNPMFMNSANSNQKTVRAAGYKSMLTKRMNDNVITGYELQIPFGQSLITFTCDGITKEPDMIALAEKVDIKSIIALAGGN